MKNPNFITAGAAVSMTMVAQYGPKLLKNPEDVRSYLSAIKKGSSSPKLMNVALECLGLRAQIGPVARKYISLTVEQVDLEVKKRTRSYKDRQRRGTLKSLQHKVVPTQKSLAACKSSCRGRDAFR